VPGSALVDGPARAATSARALWAGPAALRALAAARTGTVEIALRPGCYVRLAGAPPHWLHVVTPRAPRGPLTLVVAGLERAPLAPGARVEVRHGTVEAGPLWIELDGLTGTVADVPRLALRPGWRAALAAARDRVPVAPAELGRGLAALRKGELADAVAALAGRGGGLTPAGDDVLAGFAAWRYHDGRAPTLGSDRCSPIGLAYLRCAERGELPDAAARVIGAIRDGDARLACTRARTLSDWGASSGAAILWGIAAAGARS
jgi:Protein of unknown function (DUF2877)